MSALVEPDFIEFYNQTVKDALSRVLGASAARSVLYHARFDDKQTPGEFHESLVMMIGDGASTLERSIVKEMFAKLCVLSPDFTDFDFNASLREARSLYAKRTGSS